MAVKKTTEAAETAKTEAVDSAVTQKADTTPSGAGFCVYIGPTITGVIQSGSIHHGSKDEALANIQLAVDKYPLIKALVVPGEALAESRVKVKTPGNYLYNQYRALAGKH